MREIVVTDHNNRVLSRKESDLESFLHGLRLSFDAIGVQMNFIITRESSCDTVKLIPKDLILTREGDQVLLHDNYMGSEIKSGNMVIIREKTSGKRMVYVCIVHLNGLTEKSVQEFSDRMV